MKKRYIFFSSIVAFIIIVVVNPKLRTFLSQSGTFVLGFVSSPKSVGAILPSSPYLAEKITKNIRKSDKPLKILEVGAGTGVFTTLIGAKLKPDDILDVIELNSNFCDILKRSFEEERNIKVHCVSIMDWNPEYKYDFIISGLPFNAFNPELVRNILDKYQELIKPGGMISYFEYMFLANIKRIVLSEKEKAESEGTLLNVTEFRNKFKVQRDRVWLNMPPAYVYHLSTV